MFVTPRHLSSNRWLGGLSFSVLCSHGPASLPLPLKFLVYCLSSSWFVSSDEDGSRRPVSAGGAVPLDCVATTVVDFGACRGLSVGWLLRASQVLMTCVPSFRVRFTSFGILRSVLRRAIPWLSGGDLCDWGGKGDLRLLCSTGSCGQDTHIFPVLLAGLSILWHLDEPRIESFGVGRQLRNLARKLHPSSSLDGIPHKCRWNIHEVLSCVLPSRSSLLEAAGGRDRQRGFCTCMVKQSVWRVGCSSHSRSVDRMVVGM